ncbi:MAG: hypothetical protein IJ677_07135 [Alphaproteobacteria bacterium]|nr:hypothetical protein [Alphaproteobacteria bacterium]
MNIKEFRKSYGQNVALSVCKTAYGYGLNGHDPKPSLATACILYASAFKEHPTPIIGYRVEQEIGCVKIYKLMTETHTAQSVLQKEINDFDNQNLCIAKLGENYRQELVKCLTFPDDLIVSTYNHGGRYISVVALEGCQKASQVSAFKQIGHTLALNALGYYDRYLYNLKLIEQHKKKDGISVFDKYLLSQNIELTSSLFFNQRMPVIARETERIADYLSKKDKELGVHIRIASVEVFGDFT